MGSWYDMQVLIHGIDITFSLFKCFINMQKSETNLCGMTSEDKAIANIINVSNDISQVSQTGYQFCIDSQIVPFNMIKNHMKQLTSLFFYT